MSDTPTNEARHDRILAEWWPTCATVWGGGPMQDDELRALRWLCADVERASAQPLLAEIEMFRASCVQYVRRIAELNDENQEKQDRLNKLYLIEGNLYERIDRAEAEAQKLREALGWTMEFVPNPKTEPINPNYREDFERQYAEARKALGGS